MCATPHHGEISAPHRWLPQPSQQAAVDIISVGEDVSHGLSPPLYRDDPPLPTPSNLVKWLVACLCGRKALCLYQQHHSLSRQVWAGIPQESIISPALCNHLVSDVPNSRFRHDFLRWWLHAAGLCFQPRGGRGEVKPTMLFSDEVGKHCSPLTPTSPDSTLRYESVTWWLRWTEPIKSWVSRWTPTSPSAATPAIVSSGLPGLLTSWKP